MNERTNVKECYLDQFGERRRETQIGGQEEVKILKRKWLKKSYHFVHDSCSKLHTKAVAPVERKLIIAYA